MNAPELLARLKDQSEQDKRQRFIELLARARELPTSNVIKLGENDE